MKRTFATVVWLSATMNYAEASRSRRRRRSRSSPIEVNARTTPPARRTRRRRAARAPRRTRARRPAWPSRPTARAAARRRSTRRARRAPRRSARGDGRRGRPSPPTRPRPQSIRWTPGAASSLPACAAARRARAARFWAARNGLRRSMRSRGVRRRPPPTTVWLCRPGLRGRSVPGRLDDDARRRQRLAPGRAHAPAADSRFDCFYVYPTVSTQKTANANLKIEPAEIGDRRRAGVAVLAGLPGLGADVPAADRRRAARHHRLRDARPASPSRACSPAGGTTWRTTTTAGRSS